MAVAGPAANLVLVCLSALAIRLGVAAGVFFAPDYASALLVIGTYPDSAWFNFSLILSAFFSMNIAFVVLNMIPLPPLDGSAAVTLLMSPDRARAYQQFLAGQPMLALFGLFIAWQAFDFVFPPIFWSVLSLVYPDVFYD
jgi:hypothetical protein